LCLKYFPFSKESFSPSLLSFLPKTKTKMLSLKKSLTEVIPKSYLSISFQGNLGKKLHAMSCEQINFRNYT